jgi:hypothetical protein
VIAFRIKTRTNEVACVYRLLEQFSNDRPYQCHIYRSTQPLPSCSNLFFLMIVDIHLWFIMYKAFTLSIDSQKIYMLLNEWIHVVGMYRELYIDYLLILERSIYHQPTTSKHIKSHKRAIYHEHVKTFQCFVLCNHILISLLLLIFRIHKLRPDRNQTHLLRPLPNSLPLLPSSPMLSVLGLLQMQSACGSVLRRKHKKHISMFSRLWWRAWRLVGHHIIRARDTSESKFGKR